MHNEDPWHRGWGRGQQESVFTGEPGSKGQPAQDEVLRLSFAIEFLP